MKRVVICSLGLFLCITANSFAAPPASQIPATKAITALGQLPLSFEENRGQAPTEVKFLSRGPGYHLLLGERGADITLRQGNRHATVRMNLLQASRGANVAGLEMLPGRTNYLIPQDAAHSHTNIPNYAKIRYGGVYPGIDLLFHGEQHRLEYDFILAPGASPSRIAFRFDEAENATIDRNGELVISTAAGELRQQKPVAYQEIEGKRKIVDVSYVQPHTGVFAFRLGPYDKSRQLVIDPVLTFSTYIGGSGFETGTAVAVDSLGFVYVAGSTSSSDFPMQHQVALCRPFDDRAQEPCVSPFVVKLDPNGGNFLYATYFVVGDNGANAIAVDSQGDAYLTGATDNGFDAANRSNAFVAKLDGSGSQLLYYKTVDVPVVTQKNPLRNSGTSIVVDGSGNAYATGNFQSNVFVIKLDPNGDTLWSKTMASTTTLDSGTGLALDAAGSIYVAGYAGIDFPTTPGAFQTSCSTPSQFSACPFVAKLDAQGTAILYSTFFGDGNTNINGLAVNVAGNAYVTGATSSMALPTTNAMQPHLAGCAGSNCQTDAFITELNPTGSGLVFSTYLGGSANDAGQAITLDPSGDVYVSGNTGSTDFPTSNAIQPGLATTTDTNAFVAELNPSGSAFIYSTYLGGTTRDSANAIATDTQGNAYIAGTTSSVNFPTMRAPQPTIGGGANPFGTGGFNDSDAFVTRISNNSGGSARLVQANWAEGSAIGSLSVPFKASNAAGNLIIAFVRMSTTSQTVSVTDSAGNFYTDAVSQAQATDGHQIHIFFAANTRGGANTVRATFSGANNHPWLAIFEYSGLATTNALGQVAHAQGGGSTAFSGPLTTTQSNELSFAAVGLPASYSGNVSTGSSYTIEAQDLGTSRAATAEAFLNDPGQYSAQFNLNPATNWSVAVATFIIAPAVIPPPSITTTNMFNAVQNSQYGQYLTGTNGKLPYTWSIVGGSLPAGLNINPNNGLISGIATSTGTANFTVQVSDANSQTGTRSLTLMVNPNAPSPNVTTTSLPLATQGQPYSATLAASGGIPPYTWSLFQTGQSAPGLLPPGLTLDRNTGVISGTPTSNGFFSFFAVATDGDYHSGQSQILTIDVSTTGVSLVQSNAQMATGVSSVSTPFSSANTAGNTIIAFVRMSSSNQTVAVTDTAGNTYTDAVSQVQSSDGHQIHLFYASNIKGSTNAVQASFSSTNNHPWLAIYEYTGTLHVDRIAAAQGNGTAVNSGSTAATTSANELVFAGLGLPSNSTASITTGSGFTGLLQNPSGSPGADESNMVSSTGSYAGTFSLSTAENWSAIVATFATGNASPPPPPPPPPPSTIARIQANAAESSGVSSISVPFTAANTGGDMIIAFVRMSTTSQNVTVSDSAGNLYTDAVSQAQTSDGSQVHIFYAPKIKGGANTVTASFSGTNNHPFLAVFEYSGVTTLDSTSHAQGGNASPDSGTSATASSANTLVFGGLDLQSSSNAAVTPGPGWTMEFQDTNQNGSRAATEDVITNQPGPFDATFTLSGSANWASVVASFKP